MKYSLTWLLEENNKGNQFNFLFFWGHTQKEIGKIDKSCFSQWFPSAFSVDEITYPTAEHWMIAKKALLFNDTEQYQNILSTQSPAEAKKFGRKVKNYDDITWGKNGFDFVVEGNKHKFAQNNDMKSFLLNTADCIIVEASPFDKIWGIGTKAYEIDPLKWKGQNLLGFALMEVRDFLKNK